MPSYRRWRQEGGCFFFTVNSYGRAPLFQDLQARDLLRQAMETACAEHPWITEAIVLLPDHWHVIWRLPEGDTNYPSRISRIKKLFTQSWLSSGHLPQEVTPAQRQARRRGVWQPKYWEHTMRDAKDFKMHLDYIHSNPVKHGLVQRPCDWRWSSFHRWLAKGEYELTWCGNVDLPGQVEYFERE